jgi:SAM-dependent methyltransferase
MNCDAIAPYYCLLERACFGRSLENCRLVYLQKAKKARSALLCGGGDGRFLLALLQSNAHVNVDYVEASRTMVAVAQQRVRDFAPESLHRVTFHVADVLSFESAGGYDLIATHFLLDCFAAEELQRVLAQIRRWADEKTLWIVSEFRWPELWYQRWLAAMVIPALYAAFRLTTGLRARELPAYENAAESAGFRRLGKKVSGWGLLTAQLWMADAGSAASSL